MIKRFDIYDPRPYPDCDFLGYTPFLSIELALPRYTKPYIHYSEPRIIDLRDKVVLKLRKFYNK